MRLPGYFDFFIFFLKGGRGERKGNNLIQKKTINKRNNSRKCCPLHPKKVEKCNSNLLLAQQIFSGLQFLPWCTFLLWRREHWFPCLCTQSFILCLTLKKIRSLWRIFQWCNILAGSFVVLSAKKSNLQNSFPLFCSCIQRSLFHFLALPCTHIPLLQCKQEKIGSFYRLCVIFTREICAEWSFWLKSLNRDRSEALAL